MTWRARVNEMFDRAGEDIRDVAEIYVDNVVEGVVKNTPGPGNQYELTEYIAEGTLRGGWRGGDSPPSTAGEMDGPKDPDGDVTVASVMATFNLDGKWSIWNVIGYGYYVFYGLGNHEHIGPRRWVDEEVLRAPAHLRAAYSAVMRVR